MQAFIIRTPMKIHQILLFISLSLFSHYQTFAQDKILIITGGHEFEKQAFFEMFDSFYDIKYDTIVQPLGNEMMLKSMINEYDALVFYDMYQEITEPQKSAYLKILKRGKGMVFLHHSLVSYQEWPEFQRIIGGKYISEATKNRSKSTYKHDIDIDVEIVDPSHPITHGMKDFQIHDEVYGNYVINEDVSPILKTNHPESSDIIGWHHQYGDSRIVYLQLGHDHLAYENKNYRMLVHNAITWVKSYKTY